MLKPGDTERAAYLFYAYFHGTRISHRSDWESVIARFRESEALELVHATHRELVRILGSFSDGGLEDLLMGADGLSSYDPRASGLSLRDWIEAIAHLLAGGSPEEVAIAAARRKAAHIARAALKGEHDVILAARELSSLRFDVGTSDDDPDFLPFVLIDSETDALPIGSERSQWSVHTLERLNPDVEHAYRWAADVAQVALENIVRRFENAAEPGVAADGPVRR